MIRKGPLLMGVLAVVAVIVAGCGGGGGSPGTTGDWLVGDWQAYAVSTTYDGTRHNLSEGGISAEFAFAANHTWTGRLFVPGQGEDVGGGTWADRSDGYLLVDEDATQMRLFRQGSQLYTVLQDEFGQQVWLWLRRT